MPQWYWAHKTQRLLEIVFAKRCIFDVVFFFRQSNSSCLAKTVQRDCRNDLLYNVQHTTTERRQGENCTASMACFLSSSTLTTTVSSNCETLAEFRSSCSTSCSHVSCSDIYMWAREAVKKSYAMDNASAVLHIKMAAKQRLLHGTKFEEKLKFACHVTVSVVSEPLYIARS